MGKTVMVLVIPEPKVRKATAKPVRKHKDKTAYSRKAKHKTPRMGVFLYRQKPPLGGGSEKLTALYML